MNIHQKQVLKTWITIFAASYAMLFVQSLLFVALAILFIGGAAIEVAPILTALLSMKLLSHYASKDSFLRPSSPRAQLGAFLILLVIGRLILQANIMTGRSSGYVLLLASAIIATALIYLNTSRPAHAK